MDAVITSRDVLGVAMLLEEEGWVQDSHGELHGPKCLLGAWNMWRNGDIDEDYGAEQFALVLGFTGTPKNAVGRPKQPVNEMVAWNDEGGRRKHEVMGLLYRTATSMRIAESAETFVPEPVEAEPELVLA